MKRIFYVVLAALIAASFTACGNDKGNSSAEGSSASSVSESDSAVLNEDIDQNDVENTKKTYSDREEKVYDTKIIDLDADGKNELLVLASIGNNRQFSLWEKNGGAMNKTCDFGAGKVKRIDKISLNEAEIYGEKVFLFSFKFSGENSMTADVLSEIKKTADSFEVEHLLSHGTITYSDVSEPFTKEFYRKGWSKYDIGMDGDFGDISKDEFEMLYKMYTGTDYSGI